MSKQEAAVMSRAETGERYLGFADAVFTTTPGKTNKAGFVALTDKAIYFCVQGMMGTGSVKQVHRLAADDLQAYEGRSSSVSRGGVDVAFFAQPGQLSFGSTMTADGITLEGVVATFRTTQDGMKIARMMDTTVGVMA